MTNILDFVPLRTVHKGVLSGLSSHQLFVVLGLGTMTAFGYRFANVFCSTTWLEVWLLCTIAGCVLLITFVMAGNIHLPGVNRNAARVVAMLVMAPLCMFVLFIGTNEWSYDIFLQSKSETYGWRILTLTALTVSGTAALVSMLLESLRAAERKALEADLEKKTLESAALAAQMRVMQAQVEPHFLFNTLANVQQLVEDHSPNASPMLSNLIAYLRAAVPQMRTDMTQLKNEFDMVSHYLAIMQMRMGVRLRWSVSLPEELETCHVPPLIVITLVENAVQHGIDPKEHGGEVNVRASKQGDKIRIDVIDTGKGMSALLSKSANNGARDGFGLRNARERLATFWAGEAKMNLTPNPVGGTIASITIPFSPEDNHK
jgi:sensor histidine kinase YesM